MKKFWMVWNEGNLPPTYKHPTEQSAKDEAERLARLNPGKVFYALEAVDACKTNDILWASDKDDIPF